VADLGRHRVPFAGAALFVGRTLLAQHPAPGRPERQVYEGFPEQSWLAPNGLKCVSNWLTTDHAKWAT
jgi:hypothetical protein